MTRFHRGELETLEDYSDFFGVSADASYEEIDRVYREYIEEHRQGDGVIRLREGGRYAGSNIPLNEQESHPITIVYKFLKKKKRCDECKKFAIFMKYRDFRELCSEECIEFYEFRLSTIREITNKLQQKGINTVGDMRDIFIELQALFPWTCHCEHPWTYNLHIRNCLEDKPEVEQFRNEMLRIIEVAKSNPNQSTTANNSQQNANVNSAPSPNSNHGPSQISTSTSINSNPSNNNNAAANLSNSNNNVNNSAASPVNNFNSRRTAPANSFSVAAHLATNNTSSPRASSRSSATPAAKEHPQQYRPFSPAATTKDNKEAATDSHSENSQAENYYYASYGSSQVADSATGEKATFEPPATVSPYEETFTTPNLVNNGSKEAKNNNLTNFLPEDKNQPAAAPTSKAVPSQPKTKAELKQEIQKQLTDWPQLDLKTWQGGKYQNWQQDLEQIPDLEAVLIYQKAFLQSLAKSKSSTQQKDGLAVPQNNKKTTPIIIIGMVLLSGLIWWGYSLWKKRKLK